MIGSISSRSASFARRLWLSAPIALLMLAGTSGSAPARMVGPTPPLDVCGSIHSYRWLPAKTVPPIKGRTGSAGHQRTWPARFIVILGDVRGPSKHQGMHTDSLLKMTGDGGPVSLASDQALLVLPHDNPARLSGMKSLCVTGYVRQGDEGGVWTRYTGLRTFAGGYPGQK